LFFSYVFVGIFKTRVEYGFLSLKVFSSCNLCITFTEFRLLLQSEKLENKKKREQVFKEKEKQLDYKK
jgi:hypothetical protein